MRGIYLLCGYFTDAYTGVHKVSQKFTLIFGNKKIITANTANGLAIAKAVVTGDMTWKGLE